MLQLFLYCCASLLSATSFAQSATNQAYLDLVTEYVYKIENIYEGNWAFTYTIDDKIEHETRTYRRDTSLPFIESERLLAVNGLPPSEERLEEHMERRQRALRRRERNQNRPVEDEEEGNEKERFLDMIVTESLHFIKQEGALLYLGFQAIEEGREKIYENLQGTLVLDTEAEYIRELQVSVVESFSPFFLSKIEDGFFSIRFDLVDGIPMQSAISFELQGHAFYIRDMAEDREVYWTDLERI